MGPLSLCSGRQEAGSSRARTRACQDQAPGEGGSPPRSSGGEPPRRRELSHRGSARSRRHGCALSRGPDPSRTAGGDQGARGSLRGVGNRAEALSPRGARARSDALGERGRRPRRPRGCRWAARPGHRAPGGRGSRSAHRAHRPATDRPGPRHRRSAFSSAPGGTRGGRRPSRPEAVERLPVRRRRRSAQAPRLRCGPCG